MNTSESGGKSRRTVLKAGLGGLVGVAAAGMVGVELVNHGVLPGKATLDRIDGACVVPAPTFSISPVGPSFSGSFYSAARRRTVGFTLAYPPGHGPGSRLPLIVALHAFGGNHDKVLTGMSLAQAVALQWLDHDPLPPMAIIAADGGNGYWNPHPGDDPLGMIIDELIPRCRKKGLGRGLEEDRHARDLDGRVRGAPGRREVPGADRGGGRDRAGDLDYLRAGAGPSTLVRMRRRPRSPLLMRLPMPVRWPDVAVRVASGTDDPFHPGVEALVKVLPADAVVDISAGCHTGQFFLAQEPPSLAFLGRQQPSTRD